MEGGVAKQDALPFKGMFERGAAKQDVLSSKGILRVGQQNNLKYPL